jgi:hypothetical protein
MERPTGSAGDDEQLVGAPPPSVGVRVEMAELWEEVKGEPE